MGIRPSGGVSARTGLPILNTNTILLGLVVEKVSGQTLPDYIHDHIVVPLGMVHTSFPTTNAFPDPHAQGYTETRLAPTRQPPTGIRHGDGRPAR